MVIILLIGVCIALFILILVIIRFVIIVIDDVEKMSKQDIKTN